MTSPNPVSRATASTSRNSAAWAGTAPLDWTSMSRGNSSAALKRSSGSGCVSSSQPRNLLNGRTRRWTANRVVSSGESDSPASSRPEEQVDVVVEAEARDGPGVLVGQHLHPVDRRLECPAGPIDHDRRVDVAVAIPGVGRRRIRDGLEHPPRHHDRLDHRTVRCGVSLAGARGVVREDPHVPVRVGMDEGAASPRSGQDGPDHVDVLAQPRHQVQKGCLGRDLGRDPRSHRHLLRAW